MGFDLNCLAKNTQKIWTNWTLKYYVQFHTNDKNENLFSQNDRNGEVEHILISYEYFLINSSNVMMWLKLFSCDFAEIFFIKEIPLPFKQQ